MSEWKERYLAARRRCIEGAFPQLNPQQLQAVRATEGPLLILAGAGSGKTTVLIHRIAAILRFGRGADSTELPAGASEADAAFLESYVQQPDPAQRERAEQLCALDPAAPWQIIAITFTNKAADELKNRLSRMLGAAAEEVWASTFHSACVRILRRYVAELGIFSRNFTIYDTADSQSLIRRILKEQELDEKVFVLRSVQSTISSAKNAGVLPEEYLRQNGSDSWKRSVGRVYQTYMQRLREADAMDYDDLLLNTVLLLENSEEIRSYYQRRFRYVLVDEYQDTNVLQYRLVKLLSGQRQNLCVVGDDDQGIYKFRGATIRNIQDFEQDYPGARVIKLEQNYRSTGMILDAANAVIRENRDRRDKTLWTDNGRGNPVILYTARSENDEAQYIAGQILAGLAAGQKYGDFAVLYRINALSNRLEYALKRNGIPYRVYGGTRFYDRAEVKDMLAYLCVVANPGDTLRLRRVVNMPTRGVGETALERAEDLAAREGRPLFDILADAERYPELRRSLKGIGEFVSIIREAQEALSGPLDALYEQLLRRSGYLRMLEEKDAQENITRMENVLELKTNITSFMAERGEGATLAAFLDEMALYSDTDEMDNADDRVSLMTIHSAKGLEFPTVFLSGAEDGLFPSERAFGEESELQEERRLCYVAITRAREKLYITNAQQRMLFGRTQNKRLSRFADSIPEGLLERLPKEGAGLSAQGAGSGPSESSRTPFHAPFSRRKPAPVHLRQMEAPRATLSLRAGDQVQHSAFGKGMVLSARPMGPDTYLEIAFAESGTKKLMLSAVQKFMTKGDPE